MAMTLGGLTFNKYTPDNFDVPEPVKCISVLNTYTGVALFNWGNFIVGSKINISWDLMDLTTYNAIRALYLGTADVAWNPETNDTETYMVQILSFSGDLITTPANEYRQNIKMVLVITSVVEVEV